MDSFTELMFHLLDGKTNWSDELKKAALEQGSDDDHQYRHAVRCGIAQVKLSEAGYLLTDALAYCIELEAELAKHSSDFPPYCPTRLRKGIDHLNKNYVEDGR